MPGAQGTLWETTSTCPHPGHPHDLQLASSMLAEPSTETRVCAAGSQLLITPHRSAVRLFLSNAHTNQIRNPLDLNGALCLALAIHLSFLCHSLPEHVCARMSRSAPVRTALCVLRGGGCPCVLENGARAVKEWKPILCHNMEGVRGCIVGHPGFNR